MIFETLFATPLFGIVITLAAYSIGAAVYQKKKIPLLHPVLTASAIIMIFMMLTGIEVEQYQYGGSIITFMLGPATVALAVPLYRQIQVLKTHAVVIIVSITVGAVVSIISIILIAKAAGLPEDLIISMAPKSITTPIAVEASEKLGGLPSITALSVVFTGITGAVAGPFILRVLRIKTPTAKGLAMGTAAHAIGTARALEMGETEGAVSGLAIGLAAIITVSIAPLLFRLFL